MMKTSTPSPRPSPLREREFCDTLLKGEGSGKEAA